MLYFNQKFYIVYNVLTFKKPRQDSVYPFEILKELYSLLIGSSHIVTVENHVAEDNLSSELRVIFWSKESYDRWAQEHRKRYDELVDSINQVNSTDDNVVFERYTSMDDYMSKFPYTDYPLKNDLIDWVLIPYHKDFMIKNILPLGKILNYDGNGKFSVPETVRGEGSRFIKERTSDIIRRPLSLASTKDKNFPILLAYSFDQSILTIMYSAPWLYRKLAKLTVDAEKLAEKYIKDCDNGAVLIGHKSLGDELTVHTHRLGDEIRYTFTVVVRLTFNNDGARTKFFQPLSKNDKNLNKYYSNAMSLYDVIYNQTPYEIFLKARTSILVFSASLVPHTVEYDDDLFLFYVYDNVTFKDGALEEIKKLSQVNYFQEHPEDSRLYFFDYQ